MKRTLIVIVVVLAVGALFVAREARRKGGFLWTSSALVVEIFTRKTVPAALDRFYRDMGRYPTSKEGFAALLQAPKGDDTPKWHGPYIEADLMPLDPWGHEYLYRLPGIHNPSRYDFWSLGQDGMQSVDDVGNWSK